jgi:hypothetical protein
MAPTTPEAHGLNGHPWMRDRSGCFFPFFGCGSCKSTNSIEFGRCIRCDAKKNPSFSGRRNVQIRDPSHIIYSPIAIADTGVGAMGTQIPGTENDEHERT